MTPNQVNNDTLSNKNLIPLNYMTLTRSNYLLIDIYPNAINYWLKIPQDKLDAINDLMYYTLRGVLLFDDIQDGTLYRRNLPATNRVYGNALTLNSSIYAIGEAFQKALSLGHPMAPRVFCNDFMDFLEGQGLEIYWRDNYVCPTEDEVMAMLTKKTGSYLMMQYSLMQLFSEDERDFRDFINLFGTYMQLRDDYCNLVKVTAIEEKSRQENFKNLDNLLFCEDITEGRFTWPIIHGLKTSEGPTIRNIEFLNKQQGILVQHTRDVKLKKYCLSLLEKVGSLEYTRQTLMDMDKKLREQVEGLGGNPPFISLLDEVNNWNDK